MFSGSLFNRSLLLPAHISYMGISLTSPFQNETIVSFRSVPDRLTDLQAVRCGAGLMLAIGQVCVCMKWAHCSVNLPTLGERQ